MNKLIAAAVVALAVGALMPLHAAPAKGDLTGSPAIAWNSDRDTPYVPSPLLYDGVLS